MYARYRIFDESQNQLAKQPSYQQYGASSAVVNWTGLPCRRFPDKISQLSDVVGNPRGNNPAHQWTLTSQTRGLPKWNHTFDSSGGIPLDGFLFFPIQVYDLDRITLWPWLPDMLHSSTLTGWALDCIKQFTDQVPVKVSVANFLYELKDMKSMLPSFDRKSLSKTASNNFLAWEFGVLPFVSDIKAILSLAESVEKRLQHLRSANNADSVLSFNRDLVDEASTLFFRSITGYGSSDSGDRIRFRRLSARTSFHCGARLHMALIGLDDAMSTMKALLAAGGFNHPTRVVWNAIPYSFVLDWFFHVGKLLDTLSIQPFEGEYSLSDVWYSVKCTATWIAEAGINGYPSYYYDGGLNPTVGVIHVKSYDRLPGFPVTNVALTNGSLSPMQLALSLAMLEQKRR